MPRGASPKREREYTKLRTEFEREGRYEGGACVRIEAAVQV